jgi:acetylornithine deacetylase
MTDRGGTISLSTGVERAVRESVERRRDELVELTRELVRMPSTLGDEGPAQELVDERLRAAGFEVERIVPDADAALADPYAGYPYLSYEGRSSVAGRLAGSGGGSSLHLSGHVDVVPVERPDLWEHEPWSADVADGRIWGRGAADMKGGLAAYLVAAAAVAEACDERRGDLLFSSVIEEECGGNGMWSVLGAGYDADAVLVGEPTGLRLGHAGTGVVWARLAAAGGAGHAMLAGGEGAFDRLSRAVAALRKVEAAINEPVRDPVFAAVRERPYGMTIGRIEGGVWTASTPHELAAHVRFGFGRELEPGEVQERMRKAVAEASPEVEVRFEGFRARAYCQPTTGPLVDAVAAAHRAVAGSEPETVAFTATNDSRYVEGPCLCYGPSGGNLHGTDEWVDVETLVRTATVAALVAAAWTA